MDGKSGEVTSLREKNEALGARVALAAAAKEQHEALREKHGVVVAELKEVGGVVPPHFPPLWHPGNQAPHSTTTPPTTTAKLSPLNLTGGCR